MGVERDQRGLARHVDDAAAHAGRDHGPAAARGHERGGACVDGHHGVEAPGLQVDGALDACGAGAVHDQVEGGQRGERLFQCGDVGHVECQGRAAGLGLQCLQRVGVATYGCDLCA
ncbi:hypothetical protein FQZ97_960960 [compost metagenome]